MNPKWKVRKQDGVWIALDRWRQIRYASTDWHSAMLYVQITAQSPEKPHPPFHFEPVIWPAYTNQRERLMERIKRIERWLRENPADGEK